MDFLDRLQHGWNAFMNRDPTSGYRTSGYSYAYRPDRPRLTRGNERSIVTSIFNRIALDVADITIQHCKLDEDGRFVDIVPSRLNECLTVNANKDQTARAFIHDIVMSMFDEGVVGIVPIETTLNPNVTESYDICSMRTGKILEWFPDHVRIRVYNDKTGHKEDILVAKSTVAIVENPLFAVVNEPNSTGQRLIRKLNLLDAIDEQSGSGKMDLIISLPYSAKTETKRQQAENRRKDIEMQLAGSKYGIAYIDATEHVTQLNRPVDNNLMKQIEYLIVQLYAQMGITQSVMDGTADEKTMLNYHTRAVKPVAAAIVDAMNWKFLSKTARTRGQAIKYFKNQFELVPVNELAEAADKFTRNEIMSSNEWRQIVGLKPSKDKKADQLVNSNVRQPGETQAKVPATNNEEGGQSQNGEEGL